MSLLCEFRACRSIVPDNSPNNGLNALLDTPIHSLIKRCGRRLKYVVRTPLQVPIAPECLIRPSVHLLVEL